MRKRLPYLFTFFIVLLFSAKSNAQGYVRYSTYLGGSRVDSVETSIVVNGETYIIANTTSANYPVTNSSTYKGGSDVVVTKYDANNNIVYSTYLGGSGDEDLYQLKVLNGEVFISGTTTSSDYPVTNGSVYKGNGDVVVTKLNTIGNIIFSGYYGGDGYDYEGYSPMQIVNNELYIYGTSSSVNFPVINGTPNNASGYDGSFLMALKTTDCSTIFSTCLSGTNGAQGYYMQVDSISGLAYISGTTGSTDLPVTNGSVNRGVYNIFVASYTSTGTRTLVTYLGGNSYDEIDAMQIANGSIYLMGTTDSPDFPVTDGSVDSTNNASYIAKLTSTGNISFAKYINQATNTQYDIPLQLQVINNNIYLLDMNEDGTNNTSYSNIVKLDTAGNVLYLTTLNGTNYHYVDPGTGYTYDNGLSTMVVINGEVYLNGILNGPGYPITNGSTFYPTGTGYFTKLGAGGNIIFSEYIGKMNNLSMMHVMNNKLYMVGNILGSTYPATNGTYFSGGQDNMVLAFNTDGSTNFAGYYGGINDESFFSDYGYDAFSSLRVDSNYIYILGQTRSGDYPVTNTSTYKNNTDIYFTKIKLCPFDYDVTNDTLSPAVQTTCKHGLGQQITGKSIFIVSTEAPMLNRNGAATPQPNTEASYQWQIATAPTGPWSNITSSGSIKNYLPTGGSVNEYYRRIAFTLPDCGNPATDTSNIAAVLVNANTAPVVNAGGSFYTCPGSSITIGASPTISGGNSPYTISWDMGAGTSPNPLVSPTTSTIYTVNVTDALGCKQVSQAVVITYKANAGIDKSNCANIPVQIGGAPLSGLPGVVYNWTPNNNISDVTIAQPFVNPASNTTYSLTVTLPKTGGGTCSMTDDIFVTPGAAPTADFAGPDQVICLGDSAILGTTPEAGYTYTWSPGTYLRSNNNSTATFYPGPGGVLSTMPVPNPGAYYLTAKKAGCIFIDQVSVATIEAWVGYNGCGPRDVGTQDRTPDINETYTWTKDGGPGNFTGATNESEVPVTASIGGPTVYTLTTSYNGHTCTNQVTVGDCGCQTQIYPSAPYGCPGYDLNNGNVTLNAYSTIGDAIFNWSPAIGVSSTSGSSVQLTDDIPRTYTVTATSLSDPTFSCSGTINTNDPSFSMPVFTAPTSLISCVNQPVTLGDAGVAGYSYLWNSLGPSLSSPFVPNPTTTLTSSSKFFVQVRDINGCQITDTVAVQIEQVSADAGPNQTICSSSVVKLGTPALPNTTYIWFPAASPWQNGTDQSYAQPQVLVATDQTFLLQASSPSGCIATASVDITLNSNPTIADAPDTTICLGNGGIIGLPAIPGVIYSWTPTSGLSNAFIAQPIANPGTNTLYTVLATFPGGCSFPAIDQVFVTVSDPTFSLPSINFCPSNGPVSLGNAAPAGMLGYSWTPASAVSFANIANPTSLDPPPSNTTTYTLTVENLQGCYASNTVTIIPGQTAPVAGTNRTLCINSSTTLGNAANTTGPNINYQWSPATYLNNSSSIQPIFTAVDTGSFTYTLTKTDAILGCSSIDTIVVTVNGFTLPAFNSFTICQNSCKEIGDSVIAGVQYQWSPATGLSDPTIANPIACVGASNVFYSLVATGPSGCTETSSVLVNAYPSPAPQVTVPQVTVCSSASNVTFNPTVTPAGTYNYLWSPNDASLNNIYSATPQIYLTGTGTKQYTVTVTDAVTGCASTATALLVTNTCSSFGQIGDYVWYDTNQDGVQNINEFGASGITVTAYNSFGTILATAVTDITGHYFLQNIPPGANYYIIFRHPSGYIFTTQNTGGATAINNSKAGVNGQTASFSITAGDTITNIDAGFIPVGIPLPITLVSFTGQLTNNTIVLNWLTSAEYQNHYFIIEKSTDGISYNKIGTVNGHGTTTIAHNYTFSDMQPVAGHNFYRLIEVDYSGNNIYSEIVDVIDNVHQSLTAVYLPEQHDILVTFDKIQNGNVWFNLFADNGQLMSATSAENIISQKINVGTLASGVCMLQIINSTNNYTKKIFINK